MNINQNLKKTGGMNLLAHNENLFVELLEILPIPTYVADEKGERVLYMNPVCEKEFECKKNELTGKNLIELFWNSREYQKFFNAFEEKHKLSDQQAELKKKNGTRFFATLFVKQILYQGKSAILVMLIDITERKKSYDKSSWFAKFPELSPNPIIEVDKDGKIFYINNSAQAIFSDLYLNGLTFDIAKIFKDLHSGKTRVITKEVEANGLWFFAKYMLRPPGRIIIFCTDITKRKIAEDALQRSKERLSRAEAIAHLGSWELDIEKKELTWSDEVYRIFGLLPNEFGATYESFLEHVHPEDRLDVNQAYSESLKKGKSGYEIEHRIIRKDGEIRWVKEKCEHKKNEQGKIVRSTGMVLDITEQKKSEEKLKEQALMLAEANDAVIGYDGEHRVTYWNDAAERMYGYNAREMIGKVAYYMLKTTYIGTTREKFIEQIRNRSRAESQSVRHTKAGKKIYVESHSVVRTDSSGKVASVISIHRDITERKKYEKKLKRFSEKIAAEKARDEALLSSIGHGIVAIDKNAEVVFANQKMNYFLSRKCANLVGENLTDFLDLYDESGRQLARIERPINISLSGKNINLKNYYCLNYKKKKIYLNITASPVKLNGEIIGAVSIYTDSTKEKQIEKAKTEFVSLASHQLRTPITEISLAAEMLMSGIAGKVPVGQKKYLQNIKGGVREITALVEALLNITRIQMGNFVVNPKPIELKTFLDKLVSNFKMQIDRKELQLKKVYPKKKIELNLDTNIMQLILDNLISNAIKYTEKGQITIKLEKNEKNIIITVSDTGCGIPENQKHLVFTKLFRSDNKLKSKTKGHGLGLYMIKAITQKIGIKLSFESQEGKGTIFYVTLPVKGMKRSIQQSLI